MEWFAQKLRRELANLWEMDLDDQHPGAAQVLVDDHCGYIEDVGDDDDGDEAGGDAVFGRERSSCRRKANR